VHLNPYEAAVLAGLGGAYQVAGRIDEQAPSVEQAVEATPRRHMSLGRQQTSF